MPRVLRITSLLAAVTLLSGGCSALPEVVDTPAMKRAKQTWTERCAQCHGPRGAGDGPHASSLTTPPRSLEGHAWQANNSDADIARLIVTGGAAEGLSPEMGHNLDFEDDPAQLEAMVALIRRFGEP